MKALDIVNVFRERFFRSNNYHESNLKEPESPFIILALFSYHSVLSPTTKLEAPSYLTLFYSLLFGIIESKKHAFFNAFSI